MRDDSLLAISWSSTRLPALVRGLLVSSCVPWEEARRGHGGNPPPAAGAWRFGDDWVLFGV